LPPARQVTPRTPAEVLELASALKREKPGPHRRPGRPDPAHQRRVVAVGADLFSATSCGWELTTRPDGSPPVVFGRFEAARPNEMWTGDAPARAGDRRPENLPVRVHR